MSYSEKLAITFLKEMYSDIEKILNNSEQLLFLVESIYKKYGGFVELNPDVTRSEAFKALGNDLRNLYRACGVICNETNSIL